MQHSIKVLVFFLLVITQSVYAQSNQELARAKGQAAIKMEDEEGRFDEAIKLLQEAQKLDPDNIDYPYEIAYAYSAQKEYKKASDVLEKLLKHKDVYGRVYQALGNAYDYQGKTDKAIETYEKGLKKFPDAGELYLERGNIDLIKKEYNTALGYYEKGVESDPTFPSNYYWAAKLFCNSDEKVWGMLYGELFMNLERNSKRTAEISKLLYDTYNRGIKFNADTLQSISFSKNMTISVDDLKDPEKLKIPFGLGAYEPLLLMAVIPEKAINLSSLNRIRSEFIDRYFKGDSGSKYPNILFDYQQKIKSAGHLEAYNYWLLKSGDEEGFKKWQKENKTKWDDFIGWYGDNEIQVDEQHKFYRGQY